MSWLSSGLSDIGLGSVNQNFSNLETAFNKQPGWAKGLEIGGAAALTGGVGLGLAGIGPLAGALGGDLAGGAAAGGGSLLGATGTAGAGVDFGTAGFAGLPDLTPLAGGASGGADASTGALSLAAPDTGLGTSPGIQAINAATGGGPIDYSTSFNLGDINQIPAADAATGGGGAAPASGASSGGFWQGLTPDSITAKSLIGPAIAAGGLGYSIYNQNKTQAAQDASLKAYQTQEQQNVTAANAAAAPTLAAGETLMSYLQTGKLPPNVQSQLKQATAAAKAQAIANAARSGVSTDPTQNTALAQQLATIDQNAQTEAGNLEQQLFQMGQSAVSSANQLIASGLNSTGMQAQLQQNLINLDNQLSLQTGQAITKFAASLAPQGGAQKYTLQAA